MTVPNGNVTARRAVNCVGVESKAGTARKEWKVDDARKVAVRVSFTTGARVLSVL